MTVSAKNLLRRLLQETPVVLYISEHYQVASDYEGFNEIALTKEEFEYLRMLRDEDEN